jgi:hypothetical protein
VEHWAGAYRSHGAGVLRALDRGDCSAVEVTTLRHDGYGRTGRGQVVTA